MRSNKPLRTGEQQPREDSSRKKIPREDWTQETGAATALVIGLLVFGLLAALSVAMWAVSAADQARAKTAADLAALAAADAHRGVISAGNPCALAATIAAKHESELTTCTLLAGEGATVRIVTKAHRSGWFKGWPLPAMQAESYAGPPTIEEAE